MKHKQIALNTKVREGGKSALIEIATTGNTNNYIGYIEIYTYSNKVILEVYDRNNNPVTDWAFLE